MAMNAFNFTNVSHVDGGLPDGREFFIGGSGTGEGEHNNTSLMGVRIFVCVLGLLGNLMVIFVILVLQEYRNAVTHWYVLQLAFADSIFLLSLPFKVVEDVHGEWIYSGGMCKAKETILFLNYYSSILILTVMSVDRYIAVCHAFSNALQKLRTKRAVIAITLVIWTTSIFMCIPIMVYSDKRGLDPNCKCQYEFPKPSMTPEEHCKNDGLESEDDIKECVAERQMYGEELCIKADYNIINEIWNYEEEELSGTTLAYDDVTTHPHDHDPVVYQMGCSYATSGSNWIGFLCFNFVVMFIMPFMIMSVCYCSIAIWLKAAQVRRRSVTADSVVGAQNTALKTISKRRASASSTKARRKSLRVNFVCLILVLSFLACWLPFHAIHLAKMKGIQGSSDFCANLSAVSSVLVYLNSALNPYIYNFIGTKFGGKLRSAAGSVRQSVRKRTSSISSSGRAVRYRARKMSRGGTSYTSSITMMTKNYRSKSDEISSGDAALVQNVKSN